MNSIETILEDSQAHNENFSAGIPSRKEIRDTTEDVAILYDATIVLNIPNMYQAILRKNDGSWYALHDIRIPWLVQFKWIHGHSDMEVVYDIQYDYDRKILLVQYTQNSYCYTFDEEGNIRPVEILQVDTRWEVSELIIYASPEFSDISDKAVISDGPITDVTFH